MKYNKYWMKIKTKSKKDTQSFYYTVNYQTILFRCKEIKIKSLYTEINSYYIPLTFIFIWLPYNWIYFPYLIKLEWKYL